MASDESGLAAADVGDQGDGERQVRFLPEIADLARLAVIAQIEIFRLEISRGRARVIRNRARDGDQIDVDADIGLLLRAEQGRDHAASGISSALLVLSHPALPACTEPTSRTCSIQSANRVQTSAAGHLLQPFGVASPLHGDPGGRFVDVSQIVGRELDGNCPDVLLQTIQFCRAWDRDNPRLLS